MKPETRKEAIKELNAEQRKAWSNYRALGESIIGLQKTCPHDWQYDGHGHNYSVYKCDVCGAEEKR